MPLARGISTYTLILFSYSVIYWMGGVVQWEEFGLWSKIMYRIMYITTFLCIKFFNFLSHMQNFILIDQVDKEI